MTMGVWFEDEKKSVGWFDSMDNFKLGFGLFAAYLGSILAAGLIFFFLNEPKRKIEFGVTLRIVELRKRMALAFGKFVTGHQLSAMAILALFIHLFFWLTELFLTNNIKTNKVVIDTSKMILSEPDFFSSSWVACFISNEQEMKLAESSTTNNLLTRIFKERTLFRADQKYEKELLGDRGCLITYSDPERATTADKVFQSQIFMVASELQMSYMVAVAQSFGVARDMWVPNMAIHEFNLVLYHNLRNSFNRDYFGKVFLASLEAGLSANLYECAKNCASEEFGGSAIKIFRSLDHYVNEHIGFANLTFTNFETIFVLYFCACSLVFILFSLHHLVKFVKQRSHWFRWPFTYF